MEVPSLSEFISAQSTWFLLFSSLGLVLVVRLFLSSLWYIYAYFLRPAKDLRSTYGSWAVITGPTDGIGKALAFELARSGLNLVLVGRNPAKLSNVSSAIMHEFPTTQLRSVVIDFSGETSDGIQRLKETTDGLDVGVVINNAGVNYANATYFHEDEEAWRDVVKVNLVALTEVTHALLPRLVAKRKGAVVNIGSGSSVVVPSFPLYSIYAATKAYVDQFSRSLYVEYKKHGIDIQCQPQNNYKTSIQGPHCSLPVVPWKKFSMEVPSFSELISAQSTWFLLFSSIGLVLVVRLFLSSLWYIYAYFLRPAKDLRSTYGSWVVITGPTDGIGKALAFELARSGLNLVLVGRNPTKLSDVSSAIMHEFPTTQLRSVVIDFSGDTADGIRRLKETAEGLDVGVVINNAGVNYANATYFHEDEEAWRDVVKVNLVALTEVTHALLPRLVAKRKGAVVNIGSGSSVVVPSFPLYSIYAATKAYVDQFSRSLYVEYKKYGIDIQCQIPRYVETKMIAKVMSIKWYALFVASPSSYARSAVRWIGYESRCMPYWPHFIQWCFVSLLPDAVVHQIVLQGHKHQQKDKKAI